MDEIQEETIPLDQFLVGDRVFSGVDKPCKVEAIVRDDKGGIKWITFNYGDDLWKTLSPYEARNYYGKLQ